MTDGERRKIHEILLLFLSDTYYLKRELIDSWLDSEENIDLQDAIKDNLLPEFEWCTAISIIESAINIIMDAKDNGNI